MTQIYEMDLKEQSDNCVYDILIELQGRAAFDEFWDSIDEEVQNDIKAALCEIVFEYLESTKLED